MRRLALSSVLLVFISVAAVSTALARETPSANAGPCQTTISGHRWLVAPRGLSCSDAKRVVGQLANRKVPAGRFFPGTYKGMKCLSTSPPGAKPKYIGCGTKNQSKSMVAFRN